MVRLYGKELLWAGGPRNADRDGTPVVMLGGRLFAGVVMGGVASPITRLQDGGVGSGVLMRVKVDSNAHADVMRLSIATAGI
jgi:hypothetical protein